MARREFDRTSKRILIRAYSCLLVCALCSVARAAEAQLTARDTTTLADAIAARIRVQFGTGTAREPFVLVPHDRRAEPDVGFAARVSAAIGARDSSLIVAKPTPTTPRIQLGALGVISGDTATMTLWIGRCTLEPEILSSHDAPLAFRHIRDHSVFVERNVGGSGAGSNGCPW